MTNIYNFFKTSKQLKKDANEELLGFKGVSAGATAIYWLFFLALGGAMFVNILWLRITLACLIVLLFPPLTLGMCKFSLNLVGSTPAQIKDLFLGFKYYFKAFFLFLACFFKIMFFTVLLVVPGIKKTMSLSMCYYVLLENPKMKIGEIMKQSETLMKNHEWKLFGNILSFAGNFVLGLLSLGVYFLFLTPEFNATIALFYQDIK